MKALLLLAPLLLSSCWMLKEEDKQPAIYPIPAGYTDPTPEDGYDRGDEKLVQARVTNDASAPINPLYLQISLAINAAVAAWSSKKGYDKIKNKNTTSETVSGEVKTPL